MAVKHVLVVDDSKSARIMLGRLLEKNQLSVDMVDSADSCFDFLKSQHPDAIFMDHMMPGMSGLEAAKAIAQDAQTAAIPVVMYTSKEGDEYVQEAHDHGAFGILPKPAKQPMIDDILSQLHQAESAAPAAASADAPAQPATSKPEAQAEPQPQAAAAPEVDMAQVEQIAQQTAESVLQSNLESELSQALESRLSALQKELETTAETTAQRSVQQALEKDSASVDAKLKDATDSLRSELSSQIEQQARSIVAQAVESERQSLIEEAKQALEPRLAQLESQVQDGPDELPQQMKAEVQSLAQREAAEKGEQAASATAETVANEVAQQRLSGIGDKVSQNVFNEYARQMQSSVRKAQLMAGLAGIIGGLAVAVAVMGSGLL